MCMLWNVVIEYVLFMAVDSVVGGHIKSPKKLLLKKKEVTYQSIILCSRVL